MNVTAHSVDGNPTASWSNGTLSLGLPKGEDGYTPQKGIDYTDGDKGDPGDPGYSPTASVSKSGNTATITITDKNGTTTASVTDGSKGNPGQDGVSPSVVVNNITGGHQVIITDKTGNHSFNVLDGEDGEPGTTPVITATKSGKVTTIYANGNAIGTINDGADGQDGDTPVKGTDYWTTADKAEIVSDAVDELSPIIADEYDSTQTYTLGDYCIHEGVLCRCTTAISTAEAWTSGHWTAVALADDVRNLKTIVNDLATAESTDVGKGLSPKTVVNGKVTEWQYKTFSGGGGGGGTSDYTDLDNKPQINSVTLTGNKSLSDLGIAAESDIPDVSGFYTKPSGGIPASDLASGVIPDVSGFYTKPSGGIPASDLASGVQTSLGKADSAYQKPSGGIPSSDLASGAIPSLYYVTPEDFGAVGDGVTDDSQAVQDACDAGYAVYFGSNKTYYLASTVTIDHDCHLFGGENSVIKTKTPTGDKAPNGIVISGTLKKTTTLTTDYSSDGNTDNCNNRFTLSDMTDISIGDIMVITATDQHYHYARQYYYLGATMLITDIYDGHIYTACGMPWDIENTANVSVTIYDAPVAIVEGLKFVSDLDSVPSYRYLLDLHYCKNSSVKNCTFTQMANGLSVCYCVNTKIEAVSLSKSKWDNSISGDGYGMRIDSSTNTIVERIIATCAQHAIAISGNLPTIDVFISHCYLNAECRSPGLDTHEAVYNLVVEDSVLSTAALNSICTLNRCRIKTNRRATTSNAANISIYGNHNPDWSRIRILNTDLEEDVSITALNPSSQNPVQSFDNVFGNIEIENCTGGCFAYDPSTSATVLSNTINRLSIKNWRNCKEIYHTGSGAIKVLEINNSTFISNNAINDHNQAHGVVLTNIEHLDISGVNPLAHKVHLARSTYGENVILPKNVPISLSSDNASAKFVVCGSNLTPNDVADLVVGSVSGSSGGTLTRSVATGDNIPTISFDSNGDLVYSQNANTAKYSVYPVGAFYVKEPSVVSISAKLVNSGNTDGARFTPFIAMVNCKTGTLIDRYSGTSQTASAQGTNISFNKQVSSNCVVLCYFYCSTAVSGSVTTFEDYNVTCSANLIPAVVDQPYTARRLTGDGTILSLDGVNNIMSSELQFNVSYNADFIGNPVGLLPSGTGVTF